MTSVPTQNIFRFMVFLMVFYNFCVYPLCTAHGATNAHAQCLITLARFEKMKKTTKETHDAVQNPHSTLVTLCDGDVHTTKPYSRLTADQPFVFATDDLIARGLSSYAGSLLTNYINLPRISQNLQSSKLYLAMCPIMFSILELHSRAKNF